MKTVGIVSYNIHCNFTNYGSALQSWALSENIKKMGAKPILVDYCPKVHEDSNPLNPTKKMWDQDEESKKMIELSMSAIKDNYYKFEKFYTEKFNRSKKMYTLKNFNEIIEDEKIDMFVCGSDTIFCLEEFGFDEVYYANIPCMKNGYTVSYAASFGDTEFKQENLKELNKRLHNFKSLGIRERKMVSYIKSRVNIPVKKVVDPTLLLEAEDYDSICSKERLCTEKYLLLYARRYNKKMFDFAEKISKENGWKIVDISLKAPLYSNHISSYDAGVEEFLSLVKNAEFIVTNSFHGLIFSVQYRKEFVVFSREQADTKIDELLDLFDLKNRKMVDGSDFISSKIEYDHVHKNIEEARKESLTFLKMELDNYK